MKLAAVAISVVGLGLVGCGDGDSASNAPPSCLPGCAGSAARTYDAISYDLHASFDFDAATLTASEDIVLATTTSGSLVQLDADVDISRVHAGSQDLAFELGSDASSGTGTLAVDLSPLVGSDGTGSGGSASFTVEYTAKVGGTTDQTDNVSLIMSSSTSEDPVQSRVVYTDSEPNRALYWLVTKLDPADRALWSIDVTVDAAGNDVVSNGERVADTTANGKRTVSYALDKPIPPYLMAFAAGELVHSDRAPSDGGAPVPLSVWYRTGLDIDPNVTLDAVQSAMITFDTLIMPYPWARYSVVLLPYSGGMENATITFNDETSGEGTGDFVLNAHELSHHWFGDWVTMHTFDDVWFKEGMATVLESEAERAVRDAEDKGRLWGIDFAFTPGDAIVDDSLHGLAKYTSGPYERAGWTITQIRAKIGDAAFWDGLRSVLATYQLGSVTGEQFIRSFGLDEATVQQLLAALPQKQTPTLTETATTGTDSTTFALALSDPGATMIVPIGFDVYDGSGDATPVTLAAGSAVSVVVPAAGYLGADEQDVHAPWTADFGMDESDFATIAARLTPPAASVGAVAAYESASAAQQENSIGWTSLPVAEAADFAAFLAALDSDDAQREAVIAACAVATSDATWADAIGSDLETPPRGGFDQGYLQCGTAYPIAHFETEVAAALADGSPASVARLEYLVSFDYGDDEASVVGPVASGAPTLYLRELAGYAMQLAGNASSVTAVRGAAKSVKWAKRTHLRAFAPRGETFAPRR